MISRSFRKERSLTSKAKKLVPWKISLKVEIHIERIQRGSEAPGSSESAAEEQLPAGEDIPAVEELPTEEEPPAETWIEELDRVEKELQRERAKQAMAQRPEDIPPVELDGHSQDLPIPGSFGHRLVKKALKLLRLALFETSRDHWPNVWPLIDDGVYMVEPTKNGFMTLLTKITPEELDQVSPDGQHLRSLLMDHVRPIRNRLQHPEWYYFNNSSVVDLDLRVIEVAILLLNRRDRAGQVRVLWNNLAQEVGEIATRRTKRLLELDTLIHENPEYKISDEDLQYLHQFDEEFYKVLTDQLRPGDKYKVGQSNPYLRVAKFYIGQREMGRQCKHFVEKGFEFW